MRDGYTLADGDAGVGGDGGAAEAAPLSPAGLRGQEQPAARPQELRSKMPKTARPEHAANANAPPALVTPAPAARREWSKPAWDEPLAACDPIIGPASGHTLADGRYDPCAAPLRPLASPGELPPGPGGLDAGAGLCSAECLQHGGESASQASGAPTPSFSAQRGRGPPLSPPLPLY